jgi:SagB-type dehydrogenase family enzyme
MLKLLLVIALPLLAQESATIQLPKPAQEGGKPLLQSLRERKTSRDFSAKPLPLDVLSNLLWAAYGVNRPAEGKRTAPSAHNWQTIDVYVALKDGLYLYDASRHRLVAVAARDVREIAGTQDFVAGAPLNLVLVAQMDKMKASSEDTPIDLLVWAAIEAGSISQNVSLFCASEGLATVVRVGVQREAFAKIAKLPPDRKIVLAQTVGYPK